MKIVGYVLFALAGLLMYISEVVYFARWWDLIGIIVSVFIPPIAVFFPLIFWVKEGSFPTLYFIIWVAGIVGLVLASLASKDKQ